MPRNSDYSDEVEAFGLGLRALRESRGLTRLQVAERVGRSPDTIGTWERGEQAPNLRALFGLAGCFGMYVEELLAATVGDPENLSVRAA